MFEIVAHRGCPDMAPENTIPAFLRAAALGADAIELDVRLTADRVPVVYHYFYLDVLTSLTRPIFQYTFEELRQTRFNQRSEFNSDATSISTLAEVLDCLAGKIGIEIEIKGPEPYATDVIASTLKNFPTVFESLEIASYEPMLLGRFRDLIPGVPTDLLIPISESWMHSDVDAYVSLHRSRLAGARAVHLHITQLNRETVQFINRGGCEIHAWAVNDLDSLALAQSLEIPRLTTDRLQLALEFRKGNHHAK